MNGSNGEYSQILVIFRKELFELFRERRTIMAVVVGPLLITPIIFALIGLMVSSQIKTQNAKTYSVGLVNGPAVGFTSIFSAAHLALTPLTYDQAQTEVRKHTISSAIVLPLGLDTALSSGGSAAVQIIDDSGDSTSQDATERIQKAFQTAGTFIISSRVRAKGLPQSFARPFSVTVEAVKGGGSVGMLLLSTMLPYLLIINAFSGTIYAAFDQVAGEKERGTLETLLVSPVSRMSIVLGKFLTVVCVCLLTCLLSLVGLGITFTVFAPYMSTMGTLGIKLSLTTIVAVAAALIPLAIMFAGILLIISIYARNQKEAQTVLAPLFTVVLLPAMMSMFINEGDVGNSLAFVPVLNAALIIKLALTNRFEPVFILLAFLASISYAAIALTYAATLFQKESILLKA